MIYMCCSFLGNTCRFIYNWHHAVAKHNIKNCTFLFCSKSSRFILKSPAIITSFFRMSFVDSVYLSVFQISLRHHLVAYMSNLELRFLIFSFVISKHNNSVASQFIDKSCLILQENDSFTKNTHTSSSAILPTLRKIVIA